MGTIKYNEKSRFTIVSSFEKKEDFGSDPYGYYVEIDGIKAVDYGDDYHDDGFSKSIGFIEGYCYANNISPVPKYDHEERADYKS